MEKNEISREKYEIYAYFDDNIIRVYQAYQDKIAQEAVRKGTFGESFKMDRMTWIKPSFLWMMYRSNWARKEGQTRILAIDIKREGFDKIYKEAVPSSYSSFLYSSNSEWKKALKISEVRCQWDPERDIYGNPLSYRSLQLGLRKDMVKRYVSEWIVNLSDITQEVKKIKECIENKTFYPEMLPKEERYQIEN